MKYQYILNDVIIFETDNAHEFFQYLTNNTDKQMMNSTLYGLLDKAGSYKLSMYQAKKQ